MTNENRSKDRNKPTSSSEPNDHADDLLWVWQQIQDQTNYTDCRLTHGETLAGTVDDSFQRLSSETHEK